MVGLFLYVGEKPSTYGLPLSVTFVRPAKQLRPVLCCPEGIYLGKWCVVIRIGAIYLHICKKSSNFAVVFKEIYALWKSNHLIKVI